MKLTRLRLTGFKSFVDAAELAIEPGLTGIVGPNGCGKSNLVEALRWVMGESSAKRMRGGEMDDVIFAGSRGRSGRNIAEVVLTLENSARDAPYSFNDRDEIEVARRIERGAGSHYRVNGREVRARDVQILFADGATGAHSAALVSQGRIGALIAAKPSERRALLEEAAGISGLHARRHEAELKLQSAEENLVRVDDIVTGLTAQLDTLRRQARQAQRYRRLAEQIRRTEAVLFQARWHSAVAAEAEVAAELRAAERAVADAVQAALAAGQIRAAAEEAMPPLRMAEAEAGAQLQRLTHARDMLEQELRRVLAARAETALRLDQLAADIGREEERHADAAGALSRLEAERCGLAAQAAAQEPLLDAAARDVTESASRRAAAEAALQQATETVAAEAARSAALERQQREAAERCARLEARGAEDERQRRAVAESRVAPEARQEAAGAVAAGLEEVERARAEGERRERALAAAQAEEQRLADMAREIERRLTRLRAEADALASILAPPRQGKAAPSAGAVPLLAAMRVRDGFENAVGSVFGDTLSLAEVPLSERPEGRAPKGRFWVDLPDLDPVPPLPEGALSLAGVVDGPQVLRRRLAQSGWVEDAEVGRRLQSRLLPGQVLADRDGRLWRWDGLVAGTDAAASATAQHLRQRNRAAALAGEIMATAGEMTAAEAAVAAARRDRETALATERAGRTTLREAQAALDRARAAEAELNRKAVAAEARLAALAEASSRLDADLAEARSRLEEAATARAGLPEPVLAREAAARAASDAAASRAAEGDARAVRDRLARDTQLRGERLSALMVEEASWRKRRDASVQQRQSLGERGAALAAERDAIAGRPGEIAAETGRLGGVIAEASEAQRAAADSVAGAEARLRAATEAARQTDQAASDSRERRARSEARHLAAGEARERLLVEIAERLDSRPEALSELSGLAAGESLPEPAESAGRLDRLLRERAGMGPVNLVAETEAAETGARVADLTRERAELTEAIARLRRGISSLNEEGRSRLVAAFEAVNAHFGALFVRLFGGGEAHLTLQIDGDPLAAGLDIMARPPGKRLQVLSLLSGGEQALTALALLFAVFETQPTPVCVLDEVDAPLDDANVDRFCGMLEEVAGATGTRFLLITHHRMTMARMDRLFGVTMAERGVSQLVSVELARAARLRQTA